MKSCTEFIFSVTHLVEFKFKKCFKNVFLLLKGFGLSLPPSLSPFLPPFLLPFLPPSLPPPFHPSSSLSLSLYLSLSSLFFFKFLLKSKNLNIFKTISLLFSYKVSYSISILYEDMYSWFFLKSM